MKLGDGRILLGDDTGGGAVMLPVRLWCVGVWISSESPCTYIFAICVLTQNSTCAVHSDVGGGRVSVSLQCLLSA